MKLVTIQPFFDRRMNPQTTTLDANGLPATNYLHNPFSSLKNTLPAIYDGENAYYPLANLGYDENSWNEWILNNGYEPQAIENLRNRFISFQKEHPYTDFLAHSPTDKTEEELSSANGSNEEKPTILPPYFSKYHAKLLAPIPHPMQDILCIGMNYCQSIEERKSLTPPESMFYFGKRSYHLAGHGETLPNLETTTDFYLFEAELAVILAKPLYHAQSLEEVRAAIFGFSMFNDFTAPKIGEKFGQIYIGKSLPGFSVLGPWIIPASEFAQYQNKDNHTIEVEIQGFKNDCLVQQGSSLQMIRSVEEMLLEISQHIILAPGTILATGTPPDVQEPVDKKLKPPYKKILPGDKIDCYCPSIGHLENRIDE